MSYKIFHLNFDLNSKGLVYGLCHLYDIGFIPSVLLYSQSFPSRTPVDHPVLYKLNSTSPSLTSLSRPPVVMISVSKPFIDGFRIHSVLKYLTSKSFSNSFLEHLWYTVSINLLYLNFFVLFVCFGPRY